MKIMVQIHTGERHTQQLGVAGELYSFKENFKGVFIPTQLCRARVFSFEFRSLFLAELARCGRVLHLQERERGGGTVITFCAIVDLPG